MLVEMMMMRMMTMRATLVLEVGGRPGRSPAVTKLARVGQFKLGLRRGGNFPTGLNVRLLEGGGHWNAIML